MKKDSLGEKMMNWDGIMRSEMPTGHPKRDFQRVRAQKSDLGWRAGGAGR